MRQGVQQPPRERRTLARVACAFTVVVKSAGQRRDGAILTDVGRGGARLQVVQAFMPGQFLLIERATAQAGAPVQFKTRVVWCRYRRGPQAFEAGVRILHDVADVDHQISELVYDALDQTGSTRPLYDEHRIAPVAWSA
jgi:hypothetical protein